MEFVLGLPGAGKGLFLSKLLWRALKAQRQPVVTNLAVDLDKLQAFCDGEGNLDVRVLDWVYKLTDEQTRRFWRVRRRWVVEGELRMADWVEHAPDLEAGKGVSCSAIDAAAGGTIYLIDEAQLHFASRAWKDFGTEALWYFSQHRHFGDEVILATQNLKNLDSVLRDLGQEYHLLSNLGKQSIRGMGKGAYFKRLSFYQPPYRGGQCDNGPVYSRLPWEVAKGGWYSSAGGVGIIGDGAADTKKAARGLSPRVWVPALVVLVVGVIGLGMWLPRLVTRGALATLRQKTEAADRAINAGRHVQAASNAPAGEPVPFMASASLRAAGRGADLVRADGYASGFGAVVNGRRVAVVEPVWLVGGEIHGILRSSGREFYVARKGETE